MPETAAEALRLEGITKIYRTGGFGRGKGLKAVDRVNLSINKGEIFGVVGESGCGKSTVAKMVSHLLEPTEGTIYLENKPVRLQSKKELLDYRRKVQMVFQDPYSSLNPKKTIRKSVLMPLLSLHEVTKEEADRKFVQMMERVGIPKRLYDAYPHEMSGGQLQRVAIARALIVDPLILIADEPIAALDVSIQSQVLNLLLELQRDIGLTILFISHDLRVVEQLTNRTAIMYLGNVVEVGETRRIFSQPGHPYTKALIHSIPRLDKDDGARLEVLEGEVPSLYNVPEGCPFHTRCAFKSERCVREKPQLANAPDGSRQLACHHPVTESVGKGG